MKLLPRHLWARIVLALAAAAGAIATLAWLVEGYEPAGARALRGEGSHVDGARGAAATAVGERTPAQRAAVARTFRLRELDRQAAPVRLQGVALTSVDGTVAVARRLASLPPDIAPVVEVLADGALVLRRPPPLPAGPLAPATRSHDGHGAGLVLPACLDELGAPARTTLLGLLGRWFPERPLAPARLCPVDLRWPEHDVRRLLSWLP